MPDPDQVTGEAAVDGRSTHGSSGSSRSQPRRFSDRLKRRGPVWSISLNLTPMIDVVFLLLFFFLAVSRFGSREGMLPAQLPARAAATGEIPRTPIRIRFLADPASPGKCRVTIDHFSESPMPMSSLVETLRRIHNPQQGFDSLTPVHLLAGDEIVWDHVVNAYNAALSARYEKVFFVGLP